MTTADRPALFRRGVPAPLAQLELASRRLTARAHEGRAAQRPTRPERRVRRLPHVRVGRRPAPGRLETPTPPRAALPQAFVERRTSPSTCWSTPAASNGLRRSRTSWYAAPGGRGARVPGARVDGTRVSVASWVTAPPARCARCAASARDGAVRLPLTAPQREPDGPGSPPAQYAARMRGSGPLLLISDLMDPATSMRCGPGGTRSQLSVLHLHRPRRRLSRRWRRTRAWSTTRRFTASRSVATTTCRSAIRRATGRVAGRDRRLRRPPWRRLRGVPIRP